MLVEESLQKAFINSSELLMQTSVSWALEFSEIFYSPSFRICLLLRKFIFVMKVNLDLLFFYANSSMSSGRTIQWYVALLVSHTLVMLNRESMLNIPMYSGVWYIALLLYRCPTPGCDGTGNVNSKSAYHRT